jgi:6-phosphogluconolactonase
MTLYSRRSFVKTLAAGAAVVALSPSRAAAMARPIQLYIGTYTNRGSRGIYRAMLDVDTGALSEVQLAAESAQPSFLAISPNRRFLYAVNELGEYEGAPGGAVSAYAIVRRTGDLRILNQQPTRGAHPCHLVVDRTGRWVLAANYTGGNLSVFPIEPDGRLEPPATIVHHSGSSVNPDRQQEPHAHAIHLDARNRFAFAADLGIDRVMSYRWDARTGALRPNEPAYYATAPGAGPRHFAFHPSGRFAFVINELNSTLTALAYDANAGALSELHTVSTLPEGFTGANSCADVHVAPNGRFVYGSNRGHNSIAVFAFDARAGRLRALGHPSTEGETPRNFGIDPSGRVLLAANQNSDTIVGFHIDRQTGLLVQTSSTEVPTPVCIQFMGG